MLASQLKSINSYDKLKEREKIKRTMRRIRFESSPLGLRMASMGSASVCVCVCGCKAAETTERLPMIIILCNDLF